MNGKKSKNRRFLKWLSRFGGIKNRKNIPESGVVSKGIRTPIITPGDDLLEIVVSAVAEQTGGNIQDGDIVAVTEAVVAISESNFATYQDISTDIQKKLVGAKTIAVVDPIQSRNRFKKVLEAIASTPTLEKIYVVLTYPTDEVGNRLVSDRMIKQKKVDIYNTAFTAEEFCATFGKPCHPFTGIDYLEEYVKDCQGKTEVILCNNFAMLTDLIKCDYYLVCSIHRAEETRFDLLDGGVQPERILTLAQIMNESVNGSGFNKEFGLYGTNAMDGKILKLMPRNAQEFVYDVQAEIWQRYGALVQVMVYGDGAFKDPVGHIWELADPRVAVAKTSGLEGTPKEVKTKYLASKYPDKTPEEIEAIIAEEVAKRQATEDVTGEASLGTTPRQISDLVGSLCDLTSGSGHRQTPVILVRNYL